MHNKKDNISRNFLQGLRPFSNSIPRGLKKILKKNGYNFASVVDNWTKIVGKKYSGYCYPSNVKIGKEVKNGLLVINVMHGKELEIEYSKNELIDKINSFFGYSYIDQIKLKAVQESRLTKINNDKKNDKFKCFDKKLDLIQDKGLRNSLEELVEAYNNKND